MDKRKKKAFTLAEVLFATGILSMVVTIGTSLLLLVSSILYDGQMESINRSNFSDTIYYMTREIQSAQGIRISDNGKILKIQQRGSETYSLEYAVVESYPVSHLAFKGKRLLDLEYAASGFAFEDDRVRITFALYKNNVGARQMPREIQFDVYPRSNLVLLEVDGP